MRKETVAPPTFDPRNYGLFSVVQPRYDTPGERWTNGVIYQSECGLGATVFDPCINDAATEDTVEKPATATTPWFQALPVTVVGRWDCAPVGYTDDQMQQFATDAVNRVAEWQVEAALWTGQQREGTTATAVTGLVPRLASNEELTEGMGANGLGPELVLQTRATVVGPTGTPLDITEAMQLLEKAYLDCYGSGLGVYHMPADLSAMLWRANAVKVEGPVLKSQTNHRIALGAGYRGTGPGAASTGGSAAPANSVWIYMTGPVFAYRGPVKVLAELPGAFDRRTNMVERIAEQTHLVGWMGCCHFAALVSTGGIITGQPQQAF